ncbi:MAG: glycosyltransferase family 4 protein [Desulfitobacteriaceae bacterium]
MNILIDVASMTAVKSGIGYYTANLIQSLPKLSNKHSYTLLYSENMPTVDLPANVQLMEAKRWLWRVLPIDFLDISKKFDLYHEPNYMLRPFRNIRVVNVYDMSYRLYPQYHPSRRVAMLRFFEGRMKRANRIITVSKNAKQEIIGLLKVDADKVVVTYPGVSERFHTLNVSDVQGVDVRQYYNLPENFILYVGTIEPRKNLIRLLEAYSRVKATIGNTGVKLVLAGGKGWLNEEIYQRVQELKLTNDVIFTGYIMDEHLPTVYNMALAFVYPSLYEGFGLPPLEAMACGVPVITSKVSSLPEVVGDAGILIDPYNVDELSDAILLVVSSTELRKSLSDKGIKQASLFTWEKCARETLTVYEDCFQLRK